MELVGERPIIENLVVKKGEMIAQCHASLGLVTGFECETLTPNGAGLVKLQDVSISPSTAGYYYPGLPVRVKLLLENVREFKRHL